MELQNSSSEAAVIDGGKSNFRRKGIILRFLGMFRIMWRVVVIKPVSCIDNDIDNDLTNLSLVSSSLPPSLPSQDEL